MNTNNLVISQKLNGKNFDDWYLFIKNYLIAKKVFQFSEKDILSEKSAELNQTLVNLNAARNQLDPNNPNPELQNIISNLQEQANNQQLAVEEATTKDAMVNSIILANVSSNVLKYIRRLDSAFCKMNKIKELYKRDDKEYLNFWYRKLYSLKAKDISDTMEIINEIMELFNLLQNTSMNPNDWEKLSIMHNALPEDIKKFVNFSANVTPVDFYNDIKNKVSIRNYNNQHYSYNSSNISNENDENDMDLDLNHIYPNKNKSPRNKLFCHICKKNNHSTERCYYNKKNKNNKNHNKNKRNSNYKKRKYSNKKHYNKRNLNNIELENENCMTYDEMNNLFDDENQCLDSIEIINNNKPTCGESRDQKQNFLNCDNIYYDNNYNKNFLYNNENFDYTTWTFDTGSSEHITNNKDILTNFINKKSFMKCANNSTCCFEGYGTYEGTINGYKITLNNVLFSNDVTKSIISGIKLSKEGINTTIYTNNNKTYITLKNNNNILGTFMANNFNIIKFPIKNLTNNKQLLSTEINDQSKLLWHKRLGHFYLYNINNYLKLNNIKQDDCICYDCKIANLRKSPFNGETPKATKLLETIHSDIVGPLESSYSNKNYFITFIDEFSRKSWIFLLKDKSEAVKYILYFF